MAIQVCYNILLNYCFQPLFLFILFFIGGPVVNDQGKQVGVISRLYKSNFLTGHREGRSLPRMYTLVLALAHYENFLNNTILFVQNDPQIHLKHQPINWNSPKG